MLENNQNLNNKSFSSNNNPNENINVVVRIRGKKLDETGKISLLNILDQKTIQADDKIFHYDYVANMDSTQEEMFQHCAKTICDNSLKGYNGTIFAYGQTGSGKTYTLLGRNITKYIEQKSKNNYSFDNTNSIEMNDLSQDNDLMNISIHVNNNTSNNFRKSESNNLYVCSNLFDFCYKASEYNLPELKVGSKINIKIRKMKKGESEIIFGEMPDILINKLIENGNKTKIEFENDSINIGDEVLARITSVKPKYIYTLINNKYIGRMDIENFQGNLEKIKKLLKESIGIRKMSVESKGSTGSNVTNNYPKELLINSQIIDIIKLQNKLSPDELGINKKKKIKKLKIYQIVPQINMNNEIEIEDENGKANSGLTNDPVSSTLDDTGKQANVGIISAIKPLNKQPIILKIKNYSENRLQIPFNEIPLDMVKDDGELKYKLGHKIKFYFNKEKNNLCTIIPPSIKEKNKEIQIGKKYIARILKKLDGKGIIISIRKDVETFVDICEITDYLHYNPLDFYKIGQLVKCRILSYHEKSSKYLASLRQSIVNDEEYDIIQNGSTIKFSEKFSSTLSVDLRNKIIKFGSNNILKQNIIAIGYIISSSEKGLFIKLANNVTVRAALHELTDDSSITKPYLLYKKNNICICRIISIYDKDPNNIKINVSLKESIIKYPITLHMKDLVLNNFYNCQIISENKDKKYFIVNIIGSTFTGKLLYKNLKNKNIKLEDIIILQLIEMDKENKKYSFSNLLIDENFDKKIVINQLTEETLKKSEENMEIYKNIQNIISEATKEKEMQELIDMNINGENEEGPEEIDYEGLINRQGINPLNEENEGEEEEKEEEMENEENEENEDDEDLLEQDKNIIKDKEKTMKILTKKDDGEKENEEEEEEEDDENDMEVEDEKEDKKEKRKSSSKREKDNLKKEIKIREIERANENNEIKNVPYYERIILKDHDNSLNWIEYASYILDTLNLASARQIFERALKVIDIAKINEKLNVWVAYLNLENIYGDEKSFNSILDRAKEVCDKKLLYNHLIQIYMNSKKYEEASDTYKILIKDYFNDLEIWKKYIEFLFQINNLKNDKEGNNLMIDIIEPKEGLNKSMQVLDKKSHLDIMSWYGQLLYRYNNNEEARNIFDNILKNFPKRKDIWFVYIDKEIKFGNNIDKVRQIFDRMFEIKFKINDLKSIMKKFLEFEKNNCKNEKEMLKAQEKAKEILEKRMNQIEEKNKKESKENEEDE